MERHLQTLLLTLVAGLIAWQGVTTMKLIESSARQDERVSHLIAMVESLRSDLAEVNERYMSVKDAKLYREQFDGRLSRLEGRVSDLEDRDNG